MGPNCRKGLSIEFRPTIARSKDDDDVHYSSPSVLSQHLGLREFFLGALIMWHVLGVLTWGGPIPHQDIAMSQIHAFFTFYRFLFRSYHTSSITILAVPCVAFDNCILWTLVLKIRWIASVPDSCCQCYTQLSSFISCCPIWYTDQWKVR